MSRMIYPQSEIQAVEALLASVRVGPDEFKRIENNARDLIGRARGIKVKSGQLDAFLQRFGLETQEGIALMALAEALLRVPDPETGNRLIEDKIAAAEWLAENAQGGDWLTKAAGFGLSLTRKTLDSVFAKLGKPVIRQAILSAIRLMGHEFVLGETIEQAQAEAAPWIAKGYGISYDMLGEGARTHLQAETYFKSYLHAIDVIGRTPQTGSGMSVKLSALHPRYTPLQADICAPIMIARLRELAITAKAANLPLIVDAEESERLDLSLHIIRTVYEDTTLSGWNGFGLAIQAYHLRAPNVIEQVLAWAHGGRQLRVRLVKGAYWDAEIKRAQILGLDQYPVYTRKKHTDLSYLVCAQKLLSARGVLYPMFATHNAYSVATILTLAGNAGGYEFQRLHGMGAALHDRVLEDRAAPVSVYAPVGSYEDLLAYLARRLLENGANTSFVAQLRNPSVALGELVRNPVEEIRSEPVRAHKSIPAPRHLYGSSRLNAAGFDLADARGSGQLQQALQAIEKRHYQAAPMIAGGVQSTVTSRIISNPARPDDQVGRVQETDLALVPQAFDVAKAGFVDWAQRPAAFRATVLRQWAELMESHTPDLIALLVREAGKTIPDAVADLREAVDFCRYYAAQGEKVFDDAGVALAGPTGESNVLRLRGRGVFVCISPWNFPLAIFTGQIAAALMAGNSVIAKPAEQTPLIAAFAVMLLQRAGLPEAALTLLLGDGALGAALVAHPHVAGVAFTGSTQVGQHINRALAAKDGPIVPLIAETGGQNVMIVDSTALPEQVCDDVMLSAFGSAGQRCSALRVLYVQSDVADKIITLIKDAIATLRVGDPWALSTDIGPVIDKEAQQKLREHIQVLKQAGAWITETPVDGNLKGYFVPPTLFELQSITQLQQEVFGPVLHVVRYAEADLMRVMAEIQASGYGLTFGVQTRIESRARQLANLAPVGNVYVNRSMIGAVVGVQPFGGQGLSGTGPKAGGPHYLHRFATEQTVTINTAAAGGNAKLVSLPE